MKCIVVLLCSQAAAIAVDSSQALIRQPCECERKDKKPCFNRDNGSASLCELQHLRALMRVLLRGLFCEQRGIFSPRFASKLKDENCSYGYRETHTILCRQSRGWSSHTCFVRGRIGKAGFQTNANDQGGLLSVLLKRLGHEVRLSLKGTAHSISFVKSGVSTHGQRAWKRIVMGNGFAGKPRVWQKICKQQQFCKSLLPPFGLVVRAVSLACTRSHLTFGMAAIFVGSLNQSIAEAEPAHGNPSRYSHSSYSPTYIPSGILSVLEFLVLVMRATYLTFLFMPALITAPFADSLGTQFRQVWLHLVRHTLELAGAAFIKWGQWAATRPDLFPRDLCKELSRLHTQAPAHKFSHTRRTVEGAFGKRLHDIFEDFDEEPVASGSIAQVHKATLRFSYPGKKSKPMLVAVKVRHPGVSDIIRRDFAIINGVARLSSFVPGLRWLRLDESVQQFAVFMLTQVDLAREAAHLSRFLYNFRRWKDVSFPKPLYPLVHPAVLVETYEQGESVSRYVELSQKSRISSALAHIGTHTLLKMLLVDNFIHADMHPGNILVRIDKKKSRTGKRLFPSRPHVIFLDVGMTAELSKRDRVNLLEFFKAVALRDGRTAAECTLNFSRRQSCPDPAAFIKEVEDSFRLWGSKEGDDIHPGDCVQELLEQVRRHKVNIDGDVCTVMVTTMVLEGWQRKLDPDYNIMKTLQTLLFKVDWAKSLSYTINGIVAP